MNNQEPDSVASQAKKYWDNRGEYKEAGERLYPDYHEIRLGKIKALINSVDGDDLNVVDVGCGEGDLMAHCLDKGWNTIGFDISEKNGRGVTNHCHRTRWRSITSESKWC